MVGEHTTAPPVEEAAAATAQEREVQAPAGWYWDSTSERRRYWDGERWTEFFAEDGTSSASATRVAPPSRSEGLVIAGWVTAFLAPIVGLAVGLALSSRDAEARAGTATPSRRRSS